MPFVAGGKAPQVADINDRQVAADIAGIDFGELQGLVVQQADGVRAAQPQLGVGRNLDDDLAAGTVSHPGYVEIADEFARTQGAVDAHHLQGYDFLLDFRRGDGGLGGRHRSWGVGGAGGRSDGGSGGLLGRSAGGCVRGGGSGRRRFRRRAAAAGHHRQQEQNYGRGGGKGAPGYGERAGRGQSAEFDHCSLHQELGFKNRRDAGPRKGGGRGILPACLGAIRYQRRGGVSINRPPITRDSSIGDYYDL